MTRPINQKLMDAILNLLAKNEEMWINQIADALGKNQGLIHYYLHTHLASKVILTEEKVQGDTKAAMVRVRLK